MILTKQFIVFKDLDNKIILENKADEEWKHFYLNINYRSTRRIVNISNEFILENEHSLSRNNIIVANRNDELDPVKLETNIINFDRISNRIKLIKKEKNYNFNDFAILYRNNSSSAEIELSLNNNKIPYEILGAFRFINRQEIRDVLSYLNTLVFQDGVSVLRVFNLIKGIGKAIVERIKSLSKKEEKSIFEILSKYFGDKKLENFPEKISQNQSLNINNFVNCVEEHVEILNETEKPSSFLNNFLEKIGYFNHLKFLKKERSENVNQLLNIIINWERKFPDYNLKESISEFLIYLSLSFEDKGLNDSRDNVILSTIHQVKGLEFKVVFFVYLDEGKIPSSRSENIEALDEEKRIFYVGITRAKDILYLVSSEEKKKSSFLSSNLSFEITNDLVYNFSEESKHKLSIFEESREMDLVDNKLEYCFEEAIIIKITEKTKDKKVFYSCLVSFEKEDRHIYFWENKIDSEKWDLIKDLKKEDLISFRGSWKNNKFFAVEDFNLIESRLISSPWQRLRRSIQEFNSLGKKLVFIDFETTIQKVLNRVIEVGYIVYDGSKIITKKNYFVKPQNINFEKKITWFNNIKHSHLKEAPGWDDLIHILKDDLKNCIIISHNFKSSEYHCLRAGKYFEKGEIYHFIDTYDLAKEVLKEKKLNSHKLESLIRMIRNNDKFIEEHRALADAELHMELFLYLVKDIKGNWYIIQNSLES